MNTIKIIHIPKGSYLKQSSFTDRYGWPRPSINGRSYATQQEYRTNEDLQFDSFMEANNFLDYKFNYEKLRLFMATYSDNPDLQSLSSFIKEEFEFINTNTGEICDPFEITE